MIFRKDYLEINDRIIKENQDWFENSMKKYASYKKSKKRKEKIKNIFI
jgi:hypothetical protein